ncbi:MAG TPA: hypothetical protein VGR96_20220 [Acidobacteriaceae bacterium]|nr:hypothetical protein [Acidobacteriaceae bacterium]
MTSAIPENDLAAIYCDFFLDTVFVDLYTFVNCKLSIAGRCQNRKGRIENNGNQKSSSQETSEEGSQEGSQEEVNQAT